MSDSEITSLYRVSQLPLDADAEIFRQYPAFKLGVTNSVRYYAQLLVPLVKNIIASDSEHTDWILTGPAIAAQTMAAANLLSRELFDLYVRPRRPAPCRDPPGSCRYRASRWCCSSARDRHAG